MRRMYAFTKDQLVKMENISSSAFKMFDEARLLGEHTDLIIRANNTEFQVHKIILCGCSSYFRVLFSTCWTRSTEHFLDMPGMSQNILSLIIQYAYTRCAFITEENVVELLVAADQFLVSGLVDACCHFLESRLCPENCIGIYKFTEHFYSCSKLHQKAQLYILQHFEEILQVSEEFLELSLEQFEEIIDKDELNVKQEEVVFEAVLRWIYYAPESRKKDIATLLPKVRMGLIRLGYFINNVKSNSLVMENEACVPLITNAMKALFENDMDLHEPINLELIHQLKRPRLPSAILLAIGGWSDGFPTNVIEAYDVKAECWVDVTLEHERPRACHGTVVLNHFVYCVGGNDGVKYFNSVRKLNLITQTWHEVLHDAIEEPLLSKWFHKEPLTSEDPFTKGPSKIMVAPMHERRGYVSVALLDGIIYAIGGFGAHERSSAERYDPDTNQWTMIASMNEWRGGASATSLQGRVYICGGYTGTHHLSSAESFNPDTNQWTLIAPMRSRRCGVGVIAYRDLVYAVGGFDGASRLRSAEVYNPRTNVWSDIASMHNPRSNFDIEVVGDQLFAVGGFNGINSVCSERYDERKNEWLDIKEMAVLRTCLSCCVISGLPNMAQYAAQRDAVQTRRV